mgnify:CR=1 FL=1
MNKDIVYKVVVDPSHSFDDVWNLFEMAGVEILYGTEEEECHEFFIRHDDQQTLQSCQWVKSCEPYTIPQTDWERQWELHGHAFRDGFVNIDVSSFGKNGPEVRLIPGAGFGDLSHPTTQLMIELLSSYIEDHVVIDIGCGSGVLTFVALAMGARFAYGIDIDPEAIAHSVQNARLNLLEGRSRFFLPEDFRWEKSPQEVLILMNMIQSEQEAAWEALRSLHRQRAIVITSGIRSEEKAHYFKAMEKRGWKLQEDKEKDGWSAAVYSSTW